MLVETNCKGFTLKQVDGKLYVESGLQTFALIGRNGNTSQLKYLADHIKPTSTMTELVGLFYTRDTDGYANEQIIEMHPVSCTREEQPQ